jgi:hypothetical protein
MIQLLFLLLRRKRRYMPRLDTRTRTLLSDREESKEGPVLELLDR